MELCARAPRKFVSKWIRVAVSAGRGTGRRARRENGAVCSCYLRCWFMLIIKRHWWSVSLFCLHALQKLSSIFVQLMHISQLSHRPPSGSFLTVFLAYARPEPIKNFFQTLSRLRGCMPQAANWIWGCLVLPKQCSKFRAQLKAANTNKTSITFVIKVILF